MTSFHHPYAKNHLIPYLHVRNADQMIDFMVRTFEGELTYRLNAMGSEVAHAEVRLGEMTLMLSSMCPEGTTRSEPREKRVIPSISLMIYVPDCDATYRRALAAGAISSKEPSQMFYGDRTANIVDPEGNLWTIATHTEDMTREQIETRMKAMFPSHAS